MQALVFLHLAIFLAGFTGVLGKLIQLNEALLVWYRLFITVVTLFGFFLLKGKIPSVSLKTLLKIFGVGAVVAMHWVTFYGSIKFSNISIALVCFSTLGFFSAVIEPVVSRTKPSIPEMLLGLLPVAGVYLIFHFDTQYKTGIVFGMISAILAALFTILNKKVLKNTPASTVTLYELTGGFIFLTAILPLYLSNFNLNFSLPASSDWLWLLILAWLCTVLAFYLSMTALETVSPFTVNLSYNLEPVYGIALAFLIFHEDKELGGYFYWGLSLIVLSVILQTARVIRARNT
ncbi:MAG: DMT family transporter [Chitinophagaceae bacterium]